MSIVERQQRDVARPKCKFPPSVIRRQIGGDLSNGRFLLRRDTPDVLVKVGLERQSTNELEIGSDSPVCLHRFQSKLPAQVRQCKLERRISDGSIAKVGQQQSVVSQLCQHLRLDGHRHGTQGAEWSGKHSVSFQCSRGGRC